MKGCSHPFRSGIGFCCYPLHKMSVTGQKPAIFLTGPHVGTGRRLFGGMCLLA